LDEANNVVKKYQDLLAVSHSNGESYYDFIVTPNIFTSVANKNGIYIVGNYAFRMLGEYLLMADREKINDLRTVHYFDIKNHNIPPDIKVQTYMKRWSSENENTYKQAALNAHPQDNDGSGTIDNCYTTDTVVQNENHDPMRIVKLEIFMPNPGTIYTALGAPYAEAYTAYVQARGLKLSIFGAWRPYSTQINIEGTSSGNDFSIETPWGVYQYDIPLCTSSSDTKVLQLLNYGIDYQIWNGYPGPEMYLISAHLKAWTRGTTENYSAVIDYDQNHISPGVVVAAVVGVESYPFQSSFVLKNNKTQVYGLYRR